MSDYIHDAGPLTVPHVCQTPFWPHQKSSAFDARRLRPPYQSVTPTIDNDGDTYKLLDVLTRQVGIRGIFSDWAGTVTYYANCMRLGL